MSYRHARDIELLLRSLVPVVCPPNVDELGLTDDIIAHTQLTLDAYNPPIRNASLLGMRAYNLAAVPRFIKRAQFLSFSTQQVYFAEWWHSPVALFRFIAKSIKFLICFAYYEMPAVHQRLEYTPAAWVEKVKTKRLALYKSEIEAHESALRAADPLPRDYFLKDSFWVQPYVK